MGGEIQVHSTTVAPPVTAPKLKRVLGLWDLVYYGVILTSPIAVVPMFGQSGGGVEVMFRKDADNSIPFGTPGVRTVIPPL